MAGIVASVISSMLAVIDWHYQAKLLTLFDLHQLKRLEVLLFRIAKRKCIIERYSRVVWYMSNFVTMRRATK